MHEKIQYIVDALKTIGQHQDGTEGYAANRANLEHMVVTALFVGAFSVGLIGFVGYILETVK